jgi:hypothetical protein
MKKDVHLLVDGESNCLDTLKNPKFYKIPHHIKFCSIYIEH